MVRPKLTSPAAKVPWTPALPSPSDKEALQLHGFGAVVCSSIGFWIPVQGRLCCKWGAMVFWGLESRASPIPFIDVDA